MEYLIYTDESGLTPEESHMLIWALFIPTHLHATIKNELNKVFAKAKWQARKSRNNFLWGKIQQNDLSTIQSLLKQDKNAFEMKYSNINKTNYNFYVQFIDILFKYSWVNFCALVIDKQNGAAQYSSWDLFVNRYALLLQTNIIRNFGKNDGFTFICDEVNTPSNAKWLFEDSLLGKVQHKLNTTPWSTDKRVRAALTVSSHASLFSQACDLLLWAVTAAMRMQQWLSVKWPKISFSEHIKTSIWWKNMCQNFTVNKPFYFSVWHYCEKK